MGSMLATETSPKVPDSIRVNRLLLGAAVAVGPVFLAVVGIQLLTRDGFDLSRQPLSLLALGDWGWVQIANFVLAGLLMVVGAVGLRRTLRGRRAGTWGAGLIGVAGIGMILAGVLVSDPSMGWPPGAPEGPPDTLSWHAIGHGIGAMVTFGSLAIAAIIFARRFAGSRQYGWVGLSLLPVLAAVMVAVWPDVNSVSVAMAGGSVIVFGWLSAVAARLRTETL